MGEDEDDAKLDGMGLDAYARTSVTNPVGKERLGFGRLRSGIMRDQLSTMRTSFHLGFRTTCKVN